MPACCERSARTAGELKCSKALNCVPVGLAEVGAKNEAFFSGRVPHVRPSVHGPKKTGAALSRASVTLAKRLQPRARFACNKVKAFEEFVFNPCTLGRTWGTRPEKKAWFFDPTSAAPTDVVLWFSTLQFASSPRRSLAAGGHGLPR